MVLVIVLAVTIFPIQEQTVNAAETTKNYTSGCYTYVEYEDEEYGKGVSITGYNNKAGTAEEQSGIVKIPDTLDGKKVIGIDGAFKKNQSIISVEVPSSVKWIGYMAFFKCPSLQNVKLSEGIKEIGDHCFDECHELKHVNIPSTVEKIGEYAFSSCYTLEAFEVAPQNKYYFPLDGVLCEHQKGDCEHEDNEDCIWGEDGYCVKSKDITRVLYYPGGRKGEFVVEKDMILVGGSLVFMNALSLEKITVSPENKEYFSKDGVLYQKNQYDIYSDDGKILETISGITLVACPCAKEGTYEIPDDVTDIDYSAFSSSSLTEITIPDSIRLIGGYAFYRCNNLKKVNLGANFKKNWIGDFGYAKNLERIDIASENAEMLSINGVVYSKDKKELLLCPYGYQGSLELPDTVEKIDRHAFRDEELFSEGEYYGCSKLTNVTIPASVTDVRNINSLNSDTFHGTITGYENSAAQKYAQEKKIPFICIGKDTQNPVSTSKPNTNTVTKPAKVKLQSVKALGKKKLKVTWNQNSGVSGYQVQYALNSSFTKEKKTKNAGKSDKTKTLIGLKVKKYYYVRVRAYKKSNGKTVYGLWSTVKKCKVK